MQYKPLYNKSPSVTCTSPKNCNHFFWSTPTHPSGHLLHKNWWYLLFLSVCKMLCLMLQKYMFHHDQWYHKQYMSHFGHVTVTLVYIKLMSSQIKSSIVIYVKVIYSDNSGILHPNDWCSYSKAAEGLLWAHTDMCRIQSSLSKRKDF
jgi:hypothetical protein